MTEETLYAAKYLYGKKEKVKELLEQGGGAPISLTIGMSAPMQIVEEDTLYKYIIDGLKEEEVRVNQVFEQL